MQVCIGNAGCSSAQSLMSPSNEQPLNPSADDAMFAIELQPGAFGKLGVKPGDRVTLDYRKLRSYLR